MLFAETPLLTTDTTELNDHISQLVTAAGVGSILLEAAELASGLGGVYLRPVWDHEAAPHPILTVMDQDAGIPEFRWGQLVAVTFWSEIDRDGAQVVRHLERYEAGQILHGVYIGNDQTLGVRGDLKSFQATKALAAADTDGVIDLTPYGIEQLPVAYVPNVLPNRMRRKHVIGRWLGRADTAGLESEMSALDESWSSLIQDVELGKRRIIVPDEFLDHRGRGQGDTFSTDREIFSPLDYDPQGNGKPIEAIDFAIRSSDHLAVANELHKQILTSAGISAQALGADSSTTARTATEIASIDSLSLRTTSKKRRYWAPAISHAIHMMLLIDKHMFGANIAPERPRVEWPEIDPDEDAIAQRLNLWSVSQSASMETRVQTLHPDWSTEEVAGEVDRIKADNAVGDDPFGGLA